MIKRIFRMCLPLQCQKIFNLNKSCGMFHMPYQSFSVYCVIYQSRAYFATFAFDNIRARPLHSFFNNQQSSIIKQSFTLCTIIKLPSVHSTLIFLHNQLRFISTELAHFSRFPFESHCSITSRTTSEPESKIDARTILFGSSVSRPNTCWYLGESNEQQKAIN